MSQHKPHLSSSQYDMLTRCGEQYRRRYLCGEVIPPGIAMLVGGGVHVGAETNFRQKIESREDLPSADIIDAAVQGFKLRAADGYVLTEEEASRNPAVVVGEATDLVARLAEVHAKEQAPDYQPVAVEAGIRLELPECSHDLVGVIDLVTDTREVVDFKTASRKPSPVDADTSTQLTVYAALHASRYGDLPSSVVLDVLTKTKTPGRCRLRSGRGLGSIQALSHRLSAAVRMIDAGIFPPAAADSWACSPKWCGYWRSCRFVDSERRAQAARG